MSTVCVCKYNEHFNFIEKVNSLKTIDAVNSV